MLLNFSDLYKKYKLNVFGIIHIGAHLGNEHKTYKKHKINNFIYFEPITDTFEKLKNNVGLKDNVDFHNFALGNDTKKVEFNVSSNNGASSSVLKPKKHLIRHPRVKFTKTITVEMKKLDNVDFDRKLFNMINIDVQGYELEVFKGGAETLKSIDYIMSEVNRDEVYENCVRIEELDDYLSSFNFVRVETTWDGGIWGDAFYIKKK